jgi:hypothetical protein
MFLVKVYPLHVSIRIKFPFQPFVIHKSHLAKDRPTSTDGEECGTTFGLAGQEEIGKDSKRFWRF